MAYKDYKAAMRTKRNAVLNEIQEKNQLRRDAKLPLYDLPKEVTKVYPLTTEMQRDRRKAFAAFKVEQRRKYPSAEDIMSAVVGKGYQAERNALYTCRNIEEKVNLAWIAHRRLSGGH